MSKVDILFEQVRDNIISKLEAAKRGEKLPIWTKPWATAWPMNIATGNAYSGMNILLLSLAGGQHQWKSPYFITFKQCMDYNKKHGTELRVRKGSKQTGLIRVIDGWVPKEWKDIGGGMYENQMDGRVDAKNKVSRMLLKQFGVFNAEQIENCPEEFMTDQREGPEVSMFDVQAFVTNTNAVINHGGDRAYYSPSEDRCQQPFMSNFKSEEDYWATQLHELVHWTGHKSRCDRPQQVADKQAYAFEELIAEIGAAYMCSLFGMEAELQHVSYIDSWIKVLNDDLDAVRKAATKSFAAFEYLRDYMPMDMEDVA